MLSLISPLGLLAIYGIIGGLSDYINGYKIIGYIWWALLFESVILVASTNSLENISFILNLNGIIAGAITLFIMGFLYLQPEFFKSLSFTSFFNHDSRPFESWGGNPADVTFMGAVGTRPTGFARYAAIASLVTFCNFLNNPNLFILFLVFVFILLFSKGRTEILSFLVALSFVFFASGKLLTPLALLLVFIIAISLFSVFGNVKPRPKVVKPVEVKPQEVIPPPAPVPQPAPIIPPEVSRKIEKQEFKKKIVTLSGRTSVWKTAWEIIKKKPFIGYGFGTTQHIVRGSNEFRVSVDNTLLQSLLQTGIVGTTLLLISLSWSGYLAFNGLIFHNSTLLIESSSIAIFIILRGFTQSFAGYGADWIFLVPVIAYFSSTF